MSLLHFFLHFKGNVFLHHCIYLTVIITTCFEIFTLKLMTGLLNTQHWFVFGLRHLIKCMSLSSLAIFQMSASLAIPKSYFPSKLLTWFHLNNCLIHREVQLSYIFHFVKNIQFTLQIMNRNVFSRNWLLLVPLSFLLSIINRVTEWPHNPSETVGPLILSEPSWTQHSLSI